MQRSHAAAARREVRQAQAHERDPGDGSQGVDVADGKLWILESEPVEVAD
jgi:hypothetical protein